MASASSEGSGESAQLHRLTLAFVTVPKYHVLPEMAICVLFTPAAWTLLSLRICSGIVTGQCNKYQYFKSWQRRLWRVCTFAQARQNLVTVTKYHVLVQMRICVLFTPAASAHLNRYSHSINISYAGMQRRLWRVCTFAKARLSLVTVTKYMYHVLVQMAVCVPFM